MNDMRRIYLDHNATTPTRAEVLDAMLPYFGERCGNPSSIHLFGQEARAAIEEARDEIRQSLGAESTESITFTSGGTESDNAAVRGAAYAMALEGDHIITSSVEHHAVLETCRSLESEQFRVTYLPVDSYGMVDPDDVRRALTPSTILVSIMHANNEVGTIQPVREIGRITREAGILFHTDAVQSFGKIATDVKDLGVDLLSLSSHKIYGPKGAGALYTRTGVSVEPILYGGGNERNRRPGTENVPGIVGLGKAAGLAARELGEEDGTAVNRQVARLRDRFEKEVFSCIDRVILNGHPTARLAGTLNISFEGVEGQSLVVGLDLEGVSASTGSACMAGLTEPSHVLRAMGRTHEAAKTSVRFSIGRGNSEDDIDYAVKTLVATVARLRRISASS